jgi:hypothetical protein
MIFLKQGALILNVYWLRLTPGREYGKNADCACQGWFHAVAFIASTIPSLELVVNQMVPFVMTTPATSRRLIGHAVLAELQQQGKMERARQVFDDDLIAPDYDLDSPQSRRMVEAH